MTLGESLKSRLQEIGLTQEELSVKMDVSNAYINQVANDKGVPPTKDFCTRLAKEIDVDPDQFWKLVVPVRVAKALKHIKVTEKEAIEALSTDIAATRKLPAKKRPTVKH